MAIPRGITRGDVEQALRDYRAGVPHPYRESTRYDLVVGGRRYPPKAIVGFAARRLNGGEFLDPDRDFSGGEGRSGANRVLRDLGYEVVAKGAIPAGQPAPRDRSSGDWATREIQTVFTAYLRLLRSQLAGEQVVKRDTIRVLESELPGRTRGSIEFKIRNVSAVLYDEGLPWLEGYKPASNYQRALADAVVGALDRGTGLREELLGALMFVPSTEKPLLRLAALEVAPPADRGTRRERVPGTNVTGPWRGALVDAANRALGRRGEEWVCLLEREILTDGGRPDLAGRVEWVAQTRGDGLGYDVLSFALDGDERWIEVKTTNAGRSAPFLLTPNELGVWRAHADRYQLVRVFGFGGVRAFYRILGPPDDRLHLGTALWDARPR